MKITIVIWTVFVILIAMFIALLASFSFKLVKILSWELWLALPITLAIAGIIYGWVIYSDRRKDKKWDEIKHVPRWVTRQIRQISEARETMPGAVSAGIEYLTGTYFMYKVVFDGKAFKIFRRRRGLNKEAERNSRSASKD